MQERLKKYESEISIKEACYYGFFILLSLTKGLGFYEGQKLFLLLTAPALLLGFLKILVTPYTKKQAIMVVLFFLLASVVYYHSRQISVFFVAFTILGMKGISLKKVIHIALWVWSVCSIALSAVSYFCLEHTVYRVHAKLGLGYIFRWSLGFTHPNILHVTYLFLCALLILVLEERYAFKTYFLLMLGNFLVFFYSISYTGVAIVAMLLTSALYVKLRPRFCFIEKALINLVLPACLILSFLCPLLLYVYPICVKIQKLNFILNTRISLAEQFLRSDYRSLFGADITKVVNSSMTLDNSYVWCYINYGLIPTVILLLGYFILLFYDTHQQRTRELVILVSFLAAGWTEPLLFNSSFKNITFLFLGRLLFLQKEGAAESGLSFFVPERWRKVRIPLAKLPDSLFAAARAVCRNGAQKRKLFAGAAAGVLLGLLLCFLAYREPVGYVVPRFYTDGREETSVYLESADDPAYAGYRIMNYQDAQTPMQVISGKAVTVETARYYLGAALLGGLLGAAAALLWNLSRWRKKSAWAVAEISGYDETETAAGSHENAE